MKFARRDRASAALGELRQIKTFFVVVFCLCRRVSARAELKIPINGLTFRPIFGLRLHLFSLIFAACEQQQSVRLAVPCCSAPAGPIED